MAVHKELITALKFDEKFKNALRDYYSYGFKALRDYKGKSVRETAHADWDRLNNILSDYDYMEWSEDPYEILFISADSQAMRENPFQCVYRFCDNKQTEFFLATIASLSREFHPAFLNRKLLSRLIRKTTLSGSDKLNLQISVERAKNLKSFLRDVEKIKASPEYELLRNAADCQMSPDGLKASELFMEPCEDISEKHLDESRNKTINERLSGLVSLGVVRCSRNVSETGALGDRHYSLSHSTLKKLLKAGNETSPDFSRHLYTALDFYSRYFVFGEAGIYLLDRMDAEKDYSPFRFKHEYFMQTLNDFNRFDLLAAMEDGLWCRIIWKRSSLGFSQETLAFPMEIRVSSDTGRETLLYYDAPERSLKAVRLEFIDNIFTYSDSEVKKALSTSYSGPDTAEIEHDIEICRDRIKKLWGTALTPGRHENLLKDSNERKVCLVFRVDPQTEDYIRIRLLRECRAEEVTVSEDGYTLIFEASICDVTELHPWIRSFYSHIISYEGIDSEDFSIDGDVEAMIGAMTEPLEDEGFIGLRQSSGIENEQPQFDVTAHLGSGKKARAHEQIFNELYSVYNAVSADVFVRIASGEISGRPGIFTEKVLDQAVKDSLGIYYLKIGQETEYILPSEIREYILSQSLVLEDGESYEKPISQKEWIDPILTGIYESRILSLRYRTNRRKIITGNFAPVVVEYSKRNDRFQAYLSL